MNRQTLVNKKISVPWFQFFFRPMHRRMASVEQRCLYCERRPVTQGYCTLKFSCLIYRIRITEKKNIILGLRLLYSYNTVSVYLSFVKRLWINLEMVAIGSEVATNDDCIIFILCTIVCTGETCQWVKLVWVSLYTGGFWTTVCIYTYYQFSSSISTGSVFLDYK